VAQRTNDQGLGIMWRVVDVAGLFGVLKTHNFNGVDLKVKVTVRDSFLPENDGSTIVHFTNGRPKVRSARATWEVELTMDIAEFSSMVLGVIPFERLFHYGLVDLSDDGYLNAVARLFHAAEPPVCTSQF
jgi:predicted acetyltransferase